MPTQWAKNRRWLALKKIWPQLQMEDGVLYRVGARQECHQSQKQLVLPNALVAEVLEHCHDKSGHFGLEKTLEKITTRFWWPGYTLQATEWVKSCHACQAKNRAQARASAPMQSIPIGQPFEMWGMDFVGPLSLSSGGNRYLLVVSDYFTKWAEAIPLPDQKASTTARALVNTVILRFGMPLTIHSDQGRNFESTVIKEVCNLLGITRTRTTPYHPQGDGLVERLNRTLINALSKYVGPDQTDWDD